MRRSLHSFGPRGRPASAVARPAVPACAISPIVRPMAGGGGNRNVLPTSLAATGNSRSASRAFAKAGRGEVLADSNGGCWTCGRWNETSWRNGPWRTSARTGSLPEVERRNLTPPARLGAPWIRLMTLPVVTSREATLRLYVALSCGIHRPGNGYTHTQSRITG